VSNQARKMLVLPHCRHCGREWWPPEYVSARTTYCDECRHDRLAIASKRVRGVKFIVGKNGERVAVPDRS